MEKVAGTAVEAAFQKSGFGKEAGRVSRRMGLLSSSEASGLIRRSKEAQGDWHAISDQNRGSRINFLKEGGSCPEATLIVGGGSDLLVRLFDVGAISECVDKT